MTISGLLNAPEVSRIAFWPRGRSIAEPCRVACDGAELHCYYHEYSSDAGTVVFFHGNGEVVADYAETLPRIFERVGCNTFLVEYRGYGGSSGDPGLGHLLADCEPILARIPGPRERLIFFGRSLGCLQAVHAAWLVPNALGLILESGLDDLFEFILTRFESDLGNPFSPEQCDSLEREILACCNIQSHIERFRGNSVVAYSALDFFNRQAASKQLYSWLRGPKRLLSSHTADHNSLLRENISVYCRCIHEMLTGAFQGD